MPQSAIPKHVLDRDWKNTDNDSWLMRLKKKVQYIFAAGPNVPSGFFRWREIPITLFALKGSGMWRIENTDGSQISFIGHKWIVGKIKGILPPYYLSRINPWARWGIVLQWPLFFNFHVFYHAKGPVRPPTYQSSFGIKKMFTFGIGFKRDADKVYWLTANIGGNFE